MKSLKEIFEDHANTLSGKSEAYRVRANSLIRKSKELRIPEEVFARTPHPEHFPSLTKQVTSSSCGTCALRSMLMINYGYEIEEKDLWTLDKIQTGGNIAKQGAPPLSLAALIFHILEEEMKSRTKVFVTNHGDIEQLAYLIDMNFLPIINKPWHEGRGNHYEFLFGLEKKVHLYNPANPIPFGIHETSGFYSKYPEEFLAWWGLGKHKIKWYMVAVPREETLPPNFRGRYLTNSRES